MPHQCEKANYCPHTVCNLVDCRGLVIAYNDPTKHCAFVWNNMQGIWQCQFLTVWAFGEDVCNLDAEPTSTTDGFLLEVNRWWVSQLYYVHWMGCYHIMYHGSNNTVISVLWMVRICRFWGQVCPEALLSIFIFKCYSSGWCKSSFFDVQNNIRRLLSL